MKNINPNTFIVLYGENSTLKDLRACVSEAGENFIIYMPKEEYGDELYAKKWFDAKVLVTDPKAAKAIKAIGEYNATLARVIRDGLDPNDSMDLDHCSIWVEITLGAIKNSGHYDPATFGDFRPFYDYCAECMHMNEKISFSEYRCIRTFLENQDCLKR